ncbi:hypothetical protein niasHT_014091 [Heterodera trifolii]|uniref:Uncharacterized protein n=1 Tax=Heterodera trifolii TaxID=157864 RepID=A0ABD2LGA3_9BILA
MYIRELDSQDELPLVLLSAPRSCVRLTKDELRYAVYRLIGSNERLRADTERMQRTNALLFQIYTHVSGGNLLPNLEPPNLPIAGANQPNFPVAGANQPNLPVAGANQPQPAVQDPGLVAANQYMHLRYGELQRAQLQLTLTNDNLSEELSRVVRVNAVLTSYIDRLTPLAPQHQPHNAAGVLPHNVNPNPPGVLQPGQQLFDDNFIGAYLQDMGPN